MFFLSLPWKEKQKQKQKHLLSSFPSSYSLSSPSPVLISLLNTSLWLCVHLVKIQPLSLNFHGPKQRPKSVPCRCRRRTPPWLCISNTGMFWLSTPPQKPSSTSGSRGTHFGLRPCRKWRPQPEAGVPDETGLMPRAGVLAAPWRRGSLRAAASTSRGWVLGLLRSTCTWCWIPDRMSCGSSVPRAGNVILRLILSSIRRNLGRFRVSRVGRRCVSGLTRPAATRGSRVCTRLRMVMGRSHLVSSPLKRSPFAELECRRWLSAAATTTRAYSWVPPVCWVSAVGDSRSPPKPVSGSAGSFHTAWWTGQPRLNRPPLCSDSPPFREPLSSLL